MTTVQRKMIFAAQLLGVIVLGVLLNGIPNRPDNVEGLLGFAAAFAGARHMFTINRPWGWGLLAVTGIGALVILCLPSKPKSVMGLTGPIDLGF